MLTIPVPSVLVRKVNRSLLAIFTSGTIYTQKKADPASSNVDTKEGARNEITIDYKQHVIFTWLLTNLHHLKCLQLS